MPVVDDEAIQAVGRYVRTRRGGMTVAEAARRGELSARKWHQVEAGEGHHRETTLIKVANGLGESPKQLFEIAGLPYSEQTDDGDDLGSRVSRLEEEFAAFRTDLQRLADAVAQLDTVQDERPKRRGTR